MGRQIKASGKTVDEAVWTGLNELGLSIDEIDVEIIQKGSSGLLGIGAKPAIVLITEKDSETLDVKSLFEKERQQAQSVSRPQPKPAKPVEKTKPQTVVKPTVAAPQVEAPVRVPPVEKVEKTEKTEKVERFENANTAKVTEQEETAESVFVPTYYSESETEAQPIEYSEELAKENEAAQFLSTLLEKMDIESTVLAAEVDGGLKLKIDTELAGVLIGHRGETLDAIQYLTLLVANRNREQKEYTRVSIDTQGYREKREEVLVRLAKAKASAVRASGRAYRFEPMSPYERRVIHATLQNNPNVTTHSEGIEPHRCVVITSTRAPRRTNNRYKNNVNHHGNNRSTEQRTNTEN